MTFALRKRKGKPEKLCGKDVYHCNIIPIGNHKNRLPMQISRVFPSLLGGRTTSMDKRCPGVRLRFLRLRSRAEQQRPDSKDDNAGPPPCGGDTAFYDVISIGFLFSPLLQRSINLFPKSS